MDCLAWLRNYIIDVWEIRKHKLYDSDSGPDQQLHSRSSPVVARMCVYTA